MRELSYPGITVSYGGGSEFAEGLEKHRLATKLDPIPLVWIANPVGSGPLELQKLALVQETKSPKSEVGFRIESGESWQRDVRTLIAAATFIVIHNPEMTPGVTAEVEVVRELGRFEETFFYSPEKAATVFADIGARFRPITEEQIAVIRETARGQKLQSGTLPAATCAWLEGSSRTNIEGEVRAISRWVKQLAKARSALSIDLELDGHYYLLANLVLLEALDRMPPVLSACADALFFLGDERLQNAAQLGGKYQVWAGRITSAWDQTDGIGDTLQRLAETLRIMEGDQPEIPPS